MYFEIFDYEAQTPANRSKIVGDCKRKLISTSLPDKIIEKF